MIMLITDRVVHVCVSVLCVWFVWWNQWKVSSLRFYGMRVCVEARCEGKEYLDEPTHAVKCSNPVLWAQISGSIVCLIECFGEEGLQVILSPSQYLFKRAGVVDIVEGLVGGETLGESRPRLASCYPLLGLASDTPYAHTVCRRAACMPLKSGLLICSTCGIEWGTSPGHHMDHYPRWFLPGLSG